MAKIAWHTLSSKSTAKTRRKSPREAVVTACQVHIIFPQLVRAEGVEPSQAF